MTDDHKAEFRQRLAAEDEQGVDPSFNRSQQQEEAGEHELEEWMRERAARADREAFLAVLDKAPDVPPLPGDELPQRPSRS